MCEDGDRSGKPSSDLTDGIILPWEQKFNHDNFLAMIAPELSTEKTNAKRRAGKSQLVIRIDNFM
jgi:hypothetical protein